MRSGAGGRGHARTRARACVLASRNRQGHGAKRVGTRLVLRCDKAPKRMRACQRTHRDQTGNGYMREHLRTLVTGHRYVRRHTYHRRSSWSATDLSCPRVLSPLPVRIAHALVRFVIHLSLCLHAPVGTTCATLARTTRSSPKMNTVPTSSHPVFVVVASPSTSTPEGNALRISCLMAR